MARANFVKAARKNIYRRGVQIEANNKKGYRMDKSQPNPDGDELLVAKGESYWWWQFMRSPKSISKTKPKASQLTQSHFLSTLYGIQEDIDAYEGAETQEDYEAYISEVCDQIRTLYGDCEESYENIPDQLQEGDTGQLLQERMEYLESWASDLECIDVTIDEEGIRVDQEDTFQEEDYETPDEYSVDVEEAVQAAIQERADQILEEIKSIEYQG